VLLPGSKTGSAGDGNTKKNITHPDSETKTKEFGDRKKGGEGNREMGHQGGKGK